MTQSQINCFLAVAGEGSITRAANRLFVSQPAISKSISNLEKELGFTLFDRKDNALRLTYAGTLMYEFLSRYKEEFRRLISTIQNTAGNTPALIRMGCPTNWNPEMFYGKVMDYFARNHPGIRLSIECYPFSDLVPMLRNHQLDVILTLDMYDTEQLGLQMRRISASQCGLLYSKTYYGEASSIGDFEHADFMVYDSDTLNQFEKMIRDACQSEFVPKLRNCGNPAAALFEVLRGGGVMFNIDWDPAVRSELYHFMPLGIEIPVAAFYGEEKQDSHVTKFIDELEKLFRNE